MFAVVETGSKQYRVQPGQLIKVDLLDGDENDEIRLEKVLMVSDGAGGITIGTQVVSGAAIRATIVAQEIFGCRLSGTGITTVPSSRAS